MQEVYFMTMLNNCWVEDEQAQGEYCTLTRDRLILHDQATQEELQAFPIVRYVSGAIVAVETFPGFIDYWHTTAKKPTCGEAIELSQMGIYAYKPLEVR